MPVCSRQVPQNESREALFDVNQILRRARFFILHRFFPGSAHYWERRYAWGGNSGVGSYNQLAVFKAEFLNAFVREHGISTVIEYGCGDGNQLTLAEYPRYIGFDISHSALALCRKLFRNDETKAFLHMDAYKGESAQLTLSLDVIYHLVEDPVFDAYMQRLFDSSERFVIIYSSDSDEDPGPHVSHIRHREFTRWIERNRPGWTLIQHVPNRYPYNPSTQEGSFADFYVFERASR